VRHPPPRAHQHALRLDATVLDLARDENLARMGLGSDRAQALHAAAAAASMPFSQSGDSRTGRSRAVDWLVEDSLKLAAIDCSVASGSAVSEGHEHNRCGVAAFHSVCECILRR
jgi:hypothetical protein